MLFNVAQLLKDPIGSVRRFELADDLEGLDPELVPLGPLVGQVQLMRIHSGILLTAQLSTALQFGCNRCLEPIATQVRFTVEESFRPLTEVTTGRYLAPDEFEGAAEELEDEALLINEQHILDAREVIRQAIWLATPMAPSCNWTGVGECPNLTAYRRELAEGGVVMSIGDERVGDDEESVDPRWAALLELQRKQHSRDE